VDDSLSNLMALYGGLLVINVALTAVFWARSRSVLYRLLLIGWGTTVASFVAQGLLTVNALVMTIGFASVFPVNLAFAALLAHAAQVRVPYRRLVWLVIGAMVVASVSFQLGASFFWVGLPVALAVAAPSLVVVGLAAARWGALSTSVRALAASCFLFSLHNLDWPLLRNRPEFAALGFTLAVLIVFALSITAPAVVLEELTERQARVATEVDAARRIQNMILPREPALSGLEIVTHMRPAEQVGGDYFDVYGGEGDDWVLLGDVTGHGLGAGLVMLMTQSTIASILRARPGITPSELNFIANRVLCSNLQRLGEKRHMTVVSIRRVAPTEFAISGCHDDLFVWRSSDGSIERVAVEHFPMGIGFLGELTLEDFRESTFRMEAGDVLFVGTDGVTEAARHGDPTKGLFGDEPLREILATHGARPLAEIRDALLVRLDRFTGGTYLDDVAFIIIRMGEAST